MDKQGLYIQEPGGEFHLLQRNPDGKKKVCYFKSSMWKLIYKVEVCSMILLALIVKWLILKKNFQKDWNVNFLSIYRITKILTYTNLPKLA